MQEEIKDIEQIAGDGIDTQYERDLINYRPRLSYEKSGDKAGGLSVDTVSQDSLEVMFDTPPLISIWEDVVNTITIIDDVEKRLSEKLANFTSKVSDRFIAAAREAADRLGHKIEDSIPFSLYKKSFEHPGLPEADLIQDLFEDYQSDVAGTLNAELYADIREMQQDWEDMIPFIHKGLFGQVVTSDKYPTSISNDDINLQAIHAADEQLNQSYSQLLKLTQVNEEILFQLMIDENGSERYYQLEQEVRDNHKSLDDLNRRLYTKAEISGLIQRKSGSNSDNAELIGNSIDFLPYEGEEEQIMYHLMRQYVAKENTSMSLRKLQAVLKLSVDQKKTTTNSAKNTLRGMVGRASKKKVNGTLINGIHLRNEVFGDVYEVMEHFDGVPDNPAFEEIANHIVEGIQQADTSYYNQSMDFYKLHGADSEVRSNKLYSILDKDAARSIYKMTDSAINYMTQSNQWPNTETLPQWMNEFMGYYKSL